MWSVAETRWPVSAAVSAVPIVSMSRISPTDHVRVLVVVLMLAWLIVLLAFFVLVGPALHHHHRVQADGAGGLCAGAVRPVRADRVPGRTRAGQRHPSGIKLMVLAIVVGIGATLFGTLIRPTGEITLTQAASTILAAIAVFGLAVFVPALAAGLVSGAPQLGAGSAVATTAALGGTAIAGGTLAAAARAWPAVLPAAASRRPPL